MYGCCLFFPETQGSSGPPLPLLLSPTLGTQDSSVLPCPSWEKLSVTEPKGRRQTPGAASLTPTLTHSLCTFRALRDFLRVVALGAPRPVPLHFLTCLGDLLPGRLDSGAATLVKTAKGKLSLVWPLVLSLEKQETGSHGSSQLRTASALWTARSNGSGHQLEQAALSSSGLYPY